jgi:hypothetical protein
LLITTRLPLAGPALAGSKFTAALTAWLGASVTFETPPALNPGPVAETDEMLTFAFPVFVSVTF